MQHSCERCSLADHWQISYTFEIGVLCKKVPTPFVTLHSYESYTKSRLIHTKPKRRWAFSKKTRGEILVPLNYAFTFASIHVPYTFNKNLIQLKSQLKCDLVLNEAQILSNIHHSFVKTFLIHVYSKKFIKAFNLV